jgi:LSD1 subclass zinc finger protein
VVLMFGFGGSSKTVRCAVCGTTGEVNEDTSTNGEYPDLEGWVEIDGSIRCSSWSCQESDGGGRVGTFFWA